VRNDRNLGILELAQKEKPTDVVAGDDHATITR
jgi:hypothetical protein